MAKSNSISMPTARLERKKGYLERFMVGSVIAKYMLQEVQSNDPHAAESGSVFATVPMIPEGGQRHIATRCELPKRTRSMGEASKARK